VLGTRYLLLRQILIGHHKIELSMAGQVSDVRLPRRTVTAEPGQILIVWSDDHDVRTNMVGLVFAMRTSVLIL